MSQPPRYRQYWKFHLAPLETGGAHYVLVPGLVPIAEQSLAVSHFAGMQAHFCHERQKLIGIPFFTLARIFRLTNVILIPHFSFGLRYKQQEKNYLKMITNNTP